jgi:hemerythrin
MKTLEWTDRLSVGVALIDEQHKTWIGHYNSLAEALATQQGPSHIAETLGFLVDYTGMHFSTEKKHMSESGYPGMDAHLARHSELNKTLANLVEDFEEEGATQVLAEYMDTFLGNWLITHIQEVDMKLGAFFKEKGIHISG